MNTEGVRRRIERLESAKPRWNLAAEIDAYGEPTGPERTYVREVGGTLELTVCFGIADALTYRIPGITLTDLS